MIANCCLRMAKLLPLAVGGFLLVTAPLEPRNTALATESAAAGVDVGLETARLVEEDWICQDRRFEADRAMRALIEQKDRPVSAIPARAATAPAASSSDFQKVTTQQDAAGGCDGGKTGGCGFHTASNEQDPWWQVDLGRTVRLDRVVVYNRTDGNTAPRTRNLRILAAGEPGGAFVEVYRHNGETFYGVKENRPLVVCFERRSIAARVVRLQVPGRCSFALDEVEVYGTEAPTKNVALGCPADQKSVGPYSRAKKAAAQEWSPPSQIGNLPFSLAHTRDILRRARALNGRLQPKVTPQRLAQATAELDRCEARLARVEAAGSVPEEVRREIYLESRRLLRRIAFSNPLLDFDKILLVKRHDPAGLFHMVHQFYGFGAKPGGGLFVLSQPFSENPTLVNLLQDCVVEQGRLTGSKLAPGTFVSPEVSYDGKTILFAYTEGKAEGVEWSPRASYHIFKVRADGTGLVQLTDGPWNDFDPCFLPSGRIALISERRGGYLRCGGSSPPYHSPTYTLHSMAGDGSDLACLSLHETHEWQPSVASDGRIVYTRWDYIDRDSNVAHHIWTCFPDGRDPRSFHGNYPQRREHRPWMEMDIRAIPGSHKFVATAAAHHGHAFGSLVLIDPRRKDDGALGQLERLTPEVPFPESEDDLRPIRQCMVYGTAWPLSEDDYLCVADPDAKNRGIYWIDRDGNRELLYRDPAISCLSPIPLRARPSPPVLPDATRQATEVAQQSSEERPATIAVMNIYDSDFRWPADARPTALRVVQVLPKTTPRVNTPRIGVAEQTNARAVLGTVPLEADGSAYFEAPAGKLLYFQVLDGRGMAVQSMRSGTYLHPGEQLTCRGCHEAKDRSPQLPAQLPLALRREPSTIAPEADDANPFSYVRLVQPVFDRHCVACHREKKAVDLSGVAEGKHGWSRSYQNLAAQYGFYFHSGKGSIHSGVHGGSRTAPGAFGARASKLLEYLDARHFGVRLAADELHRVTLWLDLNSEFYGTYEDTAAQARGDVVLPTLD